MKMETNEFYSKYYKDVYYVCYGILRNEHDAEEVANDVMLKAIEKMDTLINPDALPAWLKRIANNLSINYIRDHRKHEKYEVYDENEELEEVYKSEDTPEDLIVEKEVAGILLSIINKLPMDQRTAIFMFYYENMSVREIAELYNCSESTVRGRINYGKRNMRKEIDKLSDNGIKLRAIGVLPFLFAIFKMEMESVTSGINTSQVVAMASATTAGATSAAGVTMAGENGAAVAGTLGTTSAASVTSAGTVAGTACAGKSAGMALGAKIAIGVASVALVVGGIFGISALVSDKDSSKNVVTEQNNMNFEDSSKTENDSIANSEEGTTAESGDDNNENDEVELKHTNETGLSKVELEKITKCEVNNWTFVQFVTKNIYSVYTDMDAVTDWGIELYHVDGTKLPVEDFKIIRTGEDQLAEMLDYFWVGNDNYGVFTLINGKGEVVVSGDYGDYVVVTKDFVLAKPVDNDNKMVDLYNLNTKEKVETFNWSDNNLKQAWGDDGFVIYNSVTKNAKAYYPDGKSEDLDISDMDYENAENIYRLKVDKSEVEIFSSIKDYLVNKNGDKISDEYHDMIKTNKIYSAANNFRGDFRNPRKCGFLDAEGNVICPFVFDEIPYISKNLDLKFLNIFEDGICHVIYDGKLAFINENFEIIGDTYEYDELSKWRLDLFRETSILAVTGKRDGKEYVFTPCGEYEIKEDEKLKRQSPIKGNLFCIYTENCSILYDYTLNEVARINKVDGTTIGCGFDINVSGDYVIEYGENNGIILYKVK